MRLAIDLGRGRVALGGAGAMLAASLMLALASGSAPGVSSPFEGGERPASEVDRAYGDLPLSFEPSSSRSGRAADFIARSSAGSAHLTDSGARLTLAERNGAEAVDLRLAGAQPAKAQALGRLPGQVNDLRGDDPSRWRTGIPTFERIRYPGVYPRVDIDWHGTQKRLEYDFRLAPGADASRIALRVKGADGVRLSRDGDLLIGVGERTVRQAAPVAYQPADGAVERSAVAARFQLRGETVRFELGAYDPSRPLVIDPVVLDYSSYLGGNGADQANDIVVDSAGFAYLTGRTLSTDFDTSGGVGGDAPQSDVFVSKLNPAGTQLVYSTYVGGDWHDYGAGIAVDSSGAAYVTGGTRSTDFPTLNQVPGLYGDFGTDGVAGMDAFAFKLSPAGDSLVYSSLLADLPPFSNCNCTREKQRYASDAGAAIAVDSVGSAYVTGSSEGQIQLTENRIEGFTTTPGWNTETEETGNGQYGADEIYDAFVAKFTPDGAALDYSTMLGGNANDGGTGIAVDDATGAIYISGSTSSPDFDTVNPIEGDNDAGDGNSRGYDAFVAKIDPAQTGRDALVYSTYLGGDDFDAANDIAIDSSGAAYIAGTTQSSDFNITNLTEGNSPGPDAFVSKVDPSQAGANALVYSTYLGGSRTDAADAIAVDPGGPDAGTAYVSGETASGDFPRAGALERASGGDDAFVSKLAPNGDLSCSTYLGGGADDAAKAIARGPGGSVHLAGRTESSDFDRAGGVEGDSPGPDAFVSRLSLQAPCAPEPDGPAGPAPRSDLRVFVIALDGLRPREITAATPELNELKQSATWYEQARSVFIAETLPNHAAMMTGVLPERSGVLANDFNTRNPQTERDRMAMAGLLEAPTLPTLLEDSCDISTAVVQSKEYLWYLLTGEAPDPSDPSNLRVADYHWSPIGGAFIGEPDGHAPDASVMSDGFMPWLDSNAPSPQFAFLNLGDIDRSGHIDESGATTPEGSISAFRQAALADTDTQIRLLVDKLKSSGAWDESVLIFTSDHGFDWGPQTNDIFQFGTVQVPGAQRIVGNGGAFMVYLTENADPKTTADAVAALTGVEFVATQQAGLGYPTLAEIGMDHPNAGDIVGFGKPSWRWGSDSNVIPGNHGHAVTQHQTLFVTGGSPVLADVPPGGRSVPGQKVYDPDRDPVFSPPAGGPGNLSIAPTVAKLFGIDPPEGGYDGQPLDAAFDDWAFQPHVPCGVNNAPPSLSIDDVNVSEGNSGQSNANFTVSLAAPSQNAVRVDYQTNDGTGTAPSDYDSRGPTTLTFDPGQTSKTISVPVNGDLVDEPDEAFTVELSAEVNAELAKASGTATITDDDPTPQLSIDDRGVSEGDTGTNNANFTVSLSGPSQQTVTVDYVTNDGTAQPPDDYDSQGPATLTFNPLDTAPKTVSVPVRGDLVDEPNETFTVDLSAPQNAVLAKASGTGTILDDDGPPDADGDQVPDDVDQCPNEAGPPANGGCPIPVPRDSDGDGVLDPSDACPTTPGPASNAGCPLPQVPEPPQASPQTPQSPHGTPTSCSAQVLGTAGNDTLTGTAGGDLLLGLLGADSLLGIDGPDCLFGGPGEDLLSGDAGADLLRGGDGGDRVLGGADNDAISGGRGPDRLSGGSGDDRIRAFDAGRDRVNCGPGKDQAVVNEEDLVSGSCEQVGRAG